MRNESLATPILAVLLFLTACAAHAADSDLKAIMQGLGDNVAAITQGFLTDDLERVVAGAENIANHPRIPAEQVQLVAAELGTEMPAFKQFDTSVHDLSLSIAAAAADDNADLAFAEFQRMLSNCLACHAAYKTRVADVLGGAAEQ